MRRYLLLLVPLLTGLWYGCGKDDPPPCATAGAFQGKVCKEYRYQNDTFVGTISWDWSGDELLAKRFITDKKKEVSYVLYTNDNPQHFRTETTYNVSTGQSVIFRKWETDSSGNTIRFWENKDTFDLFRSYQRDSLGRVEFMEEEHNGEPAFSEAYFYDSTDSLYKALRYDGTTGSLIAVFRIAHYMNSRRTDTYDANNNLTGYETWQYEQGKVVSIARHNASDALVSDQTFRYNSYGLLWKQSTTDSSGTTFRSEFNYF
ncbi:MAG: hypothetical protein H6585_15140 [Flavobacteriales bacterium]|nr:hypothetical protein [Flavobacteriales bacterium]MCB9449666.1 hypothetical protein [Flavobacteriales bacterium]